MNICILYYDSFWQQEAGFPLKQLKNENIFAVALENQPYICAEKQSFLPDKTIDEVNLDEVDMFIIPGGNTTHLYDNERLKNFIYELDKRNIYIAGICGGALLMGQYGILKGRKCKRIHPKFKDLFEGAIPLDEDVVVDGNLITAEGQAFIEFGIKLGQLMGVYRDDIEALERYKSMKNIKGKLIV